MSLKLVVCWICLWITVTDVSADYVLSNEKTTWDNASKNSNFATPRIQVGSSLLTVNITSDNLNENEEAWVGYYKRGTAFAYIGCGPINNKKLTIILPEPINSPGLCYSMCHKSYQHYIGLNRGKCFCMSEIPSGNIYLPACNISYKNWIAGGDEYISIYERMDTDKTVINKQSDEKCLAFEYNKPNYSITWNNCNRSYKALCKTGNNVSIAKNRRQEFYEWWYYVQACFEKNSFPITYSDIMTLSKVQTTGQKWLNVIRSDVIYKYNETSMSIRWEPIRYGHITKHVNITVLYFTKNNSEHKRYLLQTNPTRKPTSDSSTMSQMSQKYTTNSTESKPQDILTSTTPSSSSSVISSSKTSVSQTSLTSEINHTFMNSTEKFKSKTDMNALESSDVSVAVSVSITIVVLVAAVVLIIFLIRRGKIPTICIKSPALDRSFKRTSDRFSPKNNEYVESQETTYAQIDEPKANNNVDVRQDLELSNGHYAHTYFVLEPGTRESNTDVEISDPGNDNTDINDDYNTLHETVNARTKGNDTYDTTEKAALKVKARQTAEDEQESPKMLNETEEDTYNRIDRSPLKNGKTDNIYGIPNCLENDYGDVGKSREKNVQDGDDTYNHVKLNQ